ncbi:Crp/Fnr family transcriptional regulator [Spongiimicrobium salis]|uniref:Crp/Fnr family transcriptional regulator n=1 Tax=Spongiimicrobium salis TaxID=1667022 RepID=UPI00374D7430
MSTLMHMCKILEMEHFDKGNPIPLNYDEKGCIFFLKKGTVKIINSTNNTVKFIVKKGNIFGELALYNEEAASEEKAYALEDSTICYITADMMQQLMEEHRSLKNGILKVYGLRIKKLERRLQDLIHKDSATRIKEFISDYIQEFGKEEGDLLIAKNLLSHKDIGNLTNTSRQTVNNILSSLRKEGTIDYDSQNISMAKTS